MESIEDIHTHSPTYTWRRVTKKNDEQRRVLEIKLCTKRENERESKDKLNTGSMES